MSEYPHAPAAFINAIREEGTKAEACDYLQNQWNETCALRAENERLKRALVEAMIVPEAFIISGRPAHMRDDVWDQMLRSVAIARAALRASGGSE